MRKHLQFLTGRWVLVLHLLLIVQALAFYQFSQKEETLELGALSDLPENLGPWYGRQDVRLDAESLKILHPDDYLLRKYEMLPDRRTAKIFVAYFRSQRTGHAPHSPQNCLPGNGWAPETRDVISIPIGGSAGSISVNRILVAKGNQRMTVLYWYQTPTRVVPGEYRARVQLVLDSIRHNRSDTALIRIELPFADGKNDLEPAELQLVRDVHLAVQQFIPMLKNS
jgi:EpsI family protein